MKTIRAIPEGSDEMAMAVLKAAADSISMDKLKALTSVPEHDSKLTDSTALKFSDKEISKMPKTFRKEFRTQGCTCHVRKRKSGVDTWNYEIRYRRNGYNIAASANNLEAAKQKFIEKLNHVEMYGQDKTDAVPKSFTGFAEYFFETYYKRKVAPETFKNAMNRYNNHLKIRFKDTPIKNITPYMCQTLIDSLFEKGKNKTADEIFCMLNQIFNMAIKHGLISSNPIELVFRKSYERSHGTALTKEEEQKLLSDTAGTPYQLMFAVALYTGLRPNEYETAKIEGAFIRSVNSKRKGSKTEYKKIPIIAKLKPYLEGKDDLKFYGVNRIRERFHKIFPKKRLYDLRTTFYTRCQECGVSDVARDTFVGHSLGKLGNTYTDLSDEFLLKEGAKLVW